MALSKKIIELDIKCPFCIDYKMLIKKCSNGLTYNFFCKACRTSGFFEEDEYDNFFDFLEDKEHNIIFDLSADNSKIPKKGITKGLKCHCCKATEDLLLKKTKKIAICYFKCFSCNYRAYFHIGYINAFINHDKFNR